MSDEQIHGMFGWNELVTPDVEAAKAFYCGLFGWTAEVDESTEMGYTFFKLGEKAVGGLLKTPSECADAPPHWMSYIQVDSIEEATKKASSLGGTVLVPMMKVGEHGTLAVIQDPTGAVFSIWKGA